MKLLRNPNWWDSTYESTWERIKAAFKRDWDQTQHDLGIPVPDLQQTLPNTVAQAIGEEPIPARGVPAYEDAEAAYRFGYGARRYYGKEVHEWDEQMEERLRKDWADLTGHDESSWICYRDGIRRGWNHCEG